MFSSVYRTLPQRPAKLSYQMSSRRSRKSLTARSNLCYGLTMDTKLLEPVDLIDPIRLWLGRGVGVERIKQWTAAGTGPPRVAADDPRVPEDARSTYWYDPLAFWRWLLAEMPEAVRQYLLMSNAQPLLPAGLASAIIQRRETQSASAKWVTASRDSPPRIPADAELLGRVFRNLPRLIGYRPGGIPLWAAVKEATSLGQTYSRALCRRFRLEPDGKIGPTSWEALERVLGEAFDEAAYEAATGVEPPPTVQRYRQSPHGGDTP